MIDNRLNQLINVWFLPSKNTWKDFQVMAMKDIGTLCFYADGITFEGGETNIKIKTIFEISYGKQGRDFINKWVKIKYYNHLDELSEAYFADGNNRGWSGILGGTKKMYNLVKNLYNI
ncbi:hypothetical protein ACVW0P_000041 [Mucilaginibacter sp. UYNi724]